MRKFLTLFSVLMLSGVLAFSQSRTISGTVKDDSGAPVPYATVSESGTKNATTADANGNFTLKVKGSGDLKFTATGYTAVTTKAEGDIVSPTLKRNASELTAVVITTAFNIKKDERTTPYSAQVIKSDALNIIPQTNLNDALAGKVAGVQFRSQSGTKLNSQSFARIRGGLSLSGDVGPIYVVDGTIIGSDGYDIDPNNVETITILKGANATALFGSRAINGAIVITSKKSAAGKSTLSVSQGVTFDKVYRQPKLQNVYAGGGVDHLTTYNWKAGDPEEWKALDGKGFPDYTDDASWGPKMEGQEYIPWYAWVPNTKYSYKTASLDPQPDNTKDFWRTGINSNTNINFSKAGQGYNTRLSYSNQNIRGLIPDSKSDRHIISSITTFDINSIVSAGVDLTFNTQKIYGEFDDGYANNSAGNFAQWNHRDLNMNIMRELRNAKTPIGTLASWNWASNPDGYDAANPAGFYTGNYWYNFYSYQDNLSRVQNRERLYGNAFVKFQLGNHFNITGTVRRDQYNFNYENTTKSILEESGSQTGLLGSYGTGNYISHEMNYQVLAAFNKEIISDLNLNLVGGGNIFNQSIKRVDANTVNGLNIPNLYSLSNSKAQANISNSRVQQRTNSLFATGDLEFKKFISVTGAVRQDWSSTLNPKDNGLFYPSAGLSFVLSEFTRDAVPWLSFAKVYGSWGKKPLSLSPYALNFLYGLNQNQWNGNFLLNAPDKIPDQNLKGSLITSYETGVELRFAHNKIGLNVNYYNETSADQPVDIQVSGVSGFTTKTINAATVKRQGIEVTVNARLINRKNFTWSITKTFGYLIKNPVTKIVEGQSSILLTGGAFGSRYARVFQVLGKDWGQLRGGGLTRDSATGQPLVDPNTGLFVTGDVNKEWGSVVPKVTGGLQSLFTYKNFILNVSFDYQFGGHFFSLSESWGAFSGVLDYTANTNDRGQNVRESLANGGGVRVQGISAVDGKTPVDIYVDGFTYFHQFYSSRIAEPFIHKLSYVKMREVSIGYSIPVSKYGFLNNKITGATISLVARNPWIIYSDTKNFDPAEISGQFGEDGQLPSVRSLGFNVKFDF